MRGAGSSEGVSSGLSATIPVSGTLSNEGPPYWVSPQTGVFASGGLQTDLVHSSGEQLHFNEGADGGRCVRAGDRRGIRTGPQNPVAETSLFRTGGVLGNDFAPRLVRNLAQPVGPFASGGRGAAGEDRPIDFANGAIAKLLGQTGGGLRVFWRTRQFPKRAGRVDGARRGRRCRVWRTFRGENT